MSKRNVRQSSSKKDKPIANSQTLNALEQQVIAVAEQLGRIAGTAQAKADNWLSEPGFYRQLGRIRDRASALLARLSPHSGNGKERRAELRAKSREKVAAPGKKHRPAPPSAHGVKHSDQHTAKAVATRRQRTARPRQG